MWCILKICGVSWKTLTLTLWYFDKPYSFETITIQSPRIITFFLGSLFLSALLFLFFVMGRFPWWFVKRFQVIFLIIFLDVVPFNFDFQKYVLRFSFSANRKDAVQKCFNNYLLCSSCNNKERLLSSNDFSHQVLFYGNFCHYSFVCHFYLYFILHQKVLILLNSVSDRREVLKLLKSSNRRSTSEKGDIELLLLTGIIICSSPGKISMSSSWVLLIFYLTTL